MPSISLRDYQQEALSSVRENFKSGVHRQLIVLPTLAKRYNKKALILAHRGSPLAVGKF